MYITPSVVYIAYVHYTHLAQVYVHTFIVYNLYHMYSV